MGYDDLFIYVRELVQEFRSACCLS